MSRLQGERLHSLDGLRGVAALVVLLDHCMLVVPAVAVHHFDNRPAPHGSLLWFAMSTPLNLYWAGEQAVFVFFVLSGFVLIRMSESPSFRWQSYYPSRILRLYLPVLGALAFAGFAAKAIHRQPVPNDQWLDIWSHPHLHEIPADALLVEGPRLLLPPLWSLKWEVLFSLLLPLAVYLVARSARLAAAQVGVLLAITCIGNESTGGRGYLLYLPMFAVGAIMSRQRAGLQRAAGRLGGARGWLCLSTALVLTSSVWTSHVAPAGVTRATEVVGAALLVFLCAYWRPFRSLGESSVAQWLGKRSFSLYLIHFPIVVTVAFLLGRHAGLTFLIAIPASLLAADLFFRVWEGPSHRLSQAVRRALSRTPPTARQPVIVGSGQ